MEDEFGAFDGSATSFHTVSLLLVINEASALCKDKQTRKLLTMGTEIRDVSCSIEAVKGGAVDALAING